MHMTPNHAFELPAMFQGFGAAAWALLIAYCGFWLYCLMSCWKRKALRPVFPNPTHTRIFWFALTLTGNFALF